MKILLRLFLIALLTTGLAHAMDPMSAEFLKASDAVRAEEREKEEHEKKEAAVHEKETYKMLQLILSDGSEDDAFCPNDFRKNCKFRIYARGLDDDEPVGSVSFDPWNHKPTMQINDIRVDEEAFKLNIGRRLMCAVPYFFPKITSVYLGSCQKAKGFYQKLGLVPDAPDGDHFTWSSEAWKKEMGKFKFCLWGTHSVIMIVSE